jgi:hypothetical protein
MMQSPAPSWTASLPVPIPEPLDCSPAFRLEPLGPAHNERDHVAWMTSIDHIHATAGFANGEWGTDTWPFPMSLAANLADLEMHADEFERGVAFAYSVIDPKTGDVIGCVYIDPTIDLDGDTDSDSDAVQVEPSDDAPAMMRCWVRATAAHLDEQLATAVTTWLRDTWKINVRRPGRD